MDGDSDRLVRRHWWQLVDGDRQEALFRQHIDPYTSVSRSPAVHTGISPPTRTVVRLPAQDAWKLSGKDATGGNSYYGADEHRGSSSLPPPARKSDRCQRYEWRLERGPVADACISTKCRQHDDESDPHDEQGSLPAAPRENRAERREHDAATELEIDACVRDEFGGGGTLGGCRGIGLQPSVSMNVKERKRLT